MKKIWILVILAILLSFSGCAPTQSDAEQPTADVKQQPTVWKLQAPWWLITGKASPAGFRELRQALEGSLRRGGLLGGYSGYFLVKRADKHFESIKRSDTIFLILPKVKEFEALKELREKYPELFPISSEEFREFNKFSPLVYLTYDIKTERMRGVIIADEVDASLAKMLLEKDLPLNTFFRYEKGQLIEIVEEK